MRQHNKKKKIFLAVLLLFILAVSPLVSQTTSATYQSLLSGYLANDSKMQELEIKLSQAGLNLEKLQLQKSTDLTVSSGDVTVKSGSSSTSVSVSPSATLSLPTVKNTNVKVSVPVSTTIPVADEHPVSISGSGATISTDIISSADDELAVSLAKSNRSILEAQRAIESRKFAVEKEFLTSLKSLYESYSKVLTLKDTLIDKQSSLETVVIQGYSTISAKYRTAQLAVTSAERDVEEQNREFLSLLDTFGTKCGVTLTELPTDIPSVELVKITDYDKSMYTALENSIWTNEINTQNRAIDTTKSLTASAGYSFTEKTSVSSSAQGSSSNKTEQNHNAEVGASLNLNGVKMSAKVAVPVNNPESTSVTFSIAWQKNTSKLNKLSDQTEEYEAQLEAIAINNAEESYADEVSNREKKRNDLIWQKGQNDEQLILYEELATDSAKWYEQGLLSESDYRKALSDLESARIKARTTDIEWMIYNIEVKALFY